MPLHMAMPRPIMSRICESRSDGFENSFLRMRPLYAIRRMSNSPLLRARMAAEKAGSRHSSVGRVAFETRKYFPPLERVQHETFDLS